MTAHTHKKQFITIPREPNRSPFELIETQKQLALPSFQPPQQAQTEPLSRVITPSIKKSRTHHLVMGTTCSLLLGGLLTLGQLSNMIDLPLLNKIIVQQPNTNEHTSATSQRTPKETSSQPSTKQVGKAHYISVARQAAVESGIDPNVFERQIQQESNFNPQAVSPVGAIGIAQFMPETAQELGINPHNPEEALKGSATFMAQLNTQFHGDHAKALAAYNAGPTAVQQAVEINGQDWLFALPAETQHYVQVIMGQ